MKDKTARMDVGTSPQDRLRIAPKDSASISRVEGLKFPRAMLDDFLTFDRAGVSDAERRAILKHRYGKPRT